MMWRWQNRRMSMQCILSWSACRSTSICVCLCKCKNVWRTRLNTQHFEKVSYNSPGTLGLWPCRVMAMLSMVWSEVVASRVNIRRRRFDATSECAASGCLHFTPTWHLVIVCVGAWNCKLTKGLGRSIVRNGTLHLIYPLVEYSHQQKIVCAWVFILLTNSYLAFATLLQVVPVSFSTGAHLSWRTELSVFALTAHGHIVSWKKPQLSCRKRMKSSTQAYGQNTGAYMWARISGHAKFWGVLGHILAHAVEDIK